MPILKRIHRTRSITSAAGGSVMVSTRQSNYVHAQILKQYRRSWTNTSRMLSRSHSTDVLSFFQTVGKSVSYLSLTYVVCALLQPPGQVVYPLGRAWEPYTARPATHTPTKCTSSSWMPRPSRCARRRPQLAMKRLGLGLGLGSNGI